MSQILHFNQKKQFYNPYPLCFDDVCLESFCDDTYAIPNVQILCQGTIYNCSSSFFGMMNALCVMRVLECASGY